MSEYKAPQQVRIVDDLPRTGTDKVQKDKVLELFGEGGEDGDSSSEGTDSQ
jgi:non-ribosomal peptide synthetase component E (peptide arylation enzyme)